MLASNSRTIAQTIRLVSLTALVAATAGCASLGSSGPSTRAVNAVSKVPNPGAAEIKVVDVTDAVARRVLASSRARMFSAIFGDGASYRSTIGPGDVLDIAIWEAPPALLFGNITGESRASAAGAAAGSTSGRGSASLEQMVDARGQITIPFVGTIDARGRTPQDIQKEISRRLSRIAHEPQTVVRVIQNATSNVTVVGDVTTNTRLALTPKGERLLDALAAAGGVRQPVGKVMIQLTRQGAVASLPLEEIIREPAENIRLQADDVLTALYQPYSFMALGAVGNNAEIAFEGTGISLAQALGRVGGLRDDRADSRGVFIFRLEDPSALDPQLAADAKKTPDGKIPVIYKVDLRNPATFFVAQGFPIRNRDVLYVSNAPAADLQKFVTIVSQMAFSVVGITNTL